ncbi:ribosomal protein L1 [Ascoidea rubescens DSM 1968]|uniref:Ribosomal protein L1 n=1 Tax=Ascoidea rubescens DSM 1968 TaxID=1344418 RepID=A0A1D2VC68_9ASCO|nr:ribosomal protein L1 [Ascoidea rubescens DSM 1968]ODV59140.1 ribosomal protein L1 [Ascoidea rubescens DSM 1968]
MGKKENKAKNSASRKNSLKNKSKDGKPIVSDDKKVTKVVSKTNDKSKKVKESKAEDKPESKKKSEKKVTEEKVVEKKVIEKKKAKESKRENQKSANKKPTEKKAVEKKVVEKKVVEKKAVEKKSIEKKEIGKKTIEDNKAEQNDKKSDKKSDQVKSKDEKPTSKGTRKRRGRRRSKLANKPEEKIVVEEPPERNEKVEEIKKSLVKDSILKKAIEELIKFYERENKAKQDKSKGDKKSLFEEDKGIENKLFSLDIQLKKSLSKNKNFNKKLIAIPNSIYNVKDEKDFKICLIIKDKVIEKEEELEEIEKSEIPKLKKILPFAELIKFKSYEQKRIFLNEYDLFLSDEDLVKSLPKILGKEFFSKSSIKIPVGVRINSSKNAQSNKKFSAETIKNQVNKVLNSTFFIKSSGNVLHIQVGNFEKLSKEELFSNLKTIVEYFSNDDYESNIREMDLKLTKSVSLPIYISNELYVGEEDIQEEKKDESKEVIEDIEVDEEFYTANELPSGLKLTQFEKGLLELGQFETTPSFLEKKIKKLNKVEAKKAAETKKNQKKRKREESKDSENDKVIEKTLKAVKTEKAVKSKIAEKVTVAEKVEKTEAAAKTDTKTQDASTGEQTVAKTRKPWQRRKRSKVAQHTS